MTTSVISLVRIIVLFPAAILIIAVMLTAVILVSIVTIMLTIAFISMIMLAVTCFVWLCSFPSASSYLRIFF